MIDEKNQELHHAWKMLKPMKVWVLFHFVLGSHFFLKPMTFIDKKKT